jgi:hypothetical protein
LLLTPLVQPEGSLDTLPGLDDGAFEASDWCVVHELATVTEGTDGSQESEEDEKQQQGLSLSQRNASLNVKLGECALSCESFPKERSLHR